MGRRKQSNPRHNSAAHDSEILGRIKIDPNEPLVNYLAAQCFLEEHEKHTNGGSSTSLDFDADQRSLLKRQEVTRELRLKKKRRGAILEDEESDESNDTDRTPTAKAQAKPSRMTTQSTREERLKNRTQVRFEDNSDYDGEDHDTARATPKRATSSTGRRRKKQCRSPPKNKEFVFKKASELVVWKRDDGLCNIKYIGRSQELTGESGCKILGEVDLPTGEYHVQVAEGGPKDAFKTNRSALPLFAGKSITVLVDSIPLWKNPRSKSELAISNLARCIEESTLAASLCPSDKGWKLKLSICLKGFQICKPSKLPLNYRPSTARYQPAHRVSLVLAELFGTSHPELDRSDISSITAKTVYKCIDNCQIEKIQSQHSGLLPNDDLKIPGLIPKLRPYQIASVRWMMQRESTQHRCDAWKHAWVVLHSTFNLNECPLGLPVWENGNYAKKDAILFCPLMGWLATSVDEARCITLGYNRPESYDNAVRGGILAESMGLGKTVEVLALILARPRPAEKHSPAQRALFGNVRSGAQSKQMIISDQIESVTDFGDAESTNSEESISPRSQNMTDVSTPSKEVTTTSSKPAFVTPQTLDHPRETQIEERFLDDHETILGSCLCGEEIDLEKIRNDGNIVVCCQCNEPMHFKCAGFSDYEELKSSTREIKFRKMYSNQTWSCWLTKCYKNCPCCFSDKGDVVKSRCTLIVTPPAILNQWEREIKKHTMDLKVFVYNGVEKVTKGRGDMTSLHPYHLADHDIVLMTFDGLMNDFGHSDENKFVGSDRSSNLRKRKRYRVVPSPLSAIDWWRVCLDEAQRVERPTATSAQMALKLSASTRWCVTGTPVGRGKLEDLYGLLLFVRMNPFWIRSFFNKALDPSHPDILDRIKGTLDNVIWRSTKSNEVIRKQMGVPEQVERKNVIRFSSIEKHFYERQLQQTLQSASDFAERRKSGKQDKSKQLNMLAEHLHRLRAACCHPQVGSSGLSKSKTSQARVGQRIMTMSEILIKLIDDSRLKCEESQRSVILHTNGMAALSRLKVDARTRGVVIKETDLEVLSKSCGLYLEALQLAEGNSRPTPILADAIVQSIGFRIPRSVIKGGKGVLEWKLEQRASRLVATVDFEGPARRVSSFQLLPKLQVPKALMQEVSEDFTWGILVAKTCRLEVMNANLGGAFVEVSRFSCGEDESWSSKDGFYSTKSKNWRLVLEEFSIAKTHGEGEVNSYYVGVEVVFHEADIASDPLQKLHSLHNAQKSFEALKSLEDNGTVSNMQFSGLSVNEKMHELEEESKSIELMYMQKGRTLHSASCHRFVEVSKSRRKAEESLFVQSPSVDDIWDSGWWDDFLVACEIWGSSEQKAQVYQQFFEEHTLFQNAGKLAGLIRFPNVSDLSGLRVALQSRVNGIRSGLGKNAGWIGTVHEESKVFERRHDFFKCGKRAFSKTMSEVSRLNTNVSSEELYENATCKICKADFNQHGPQCRHCRLGDKINELEPDRVTIKILTILHNILRGSLGATILSQSGDDPNIAERAKIFFEVLDAQRKEKMEAWRLWRIHLDLLNDMDELQQCKEAMRLTYDGEDLSAHSKEQMNAIVLPSDLGALYHENAAKQAMAYGDLRRSKDTLRYLRNQEDQLGTQNGEDKDEQCAVCLSPFGDVDQAVLRCGHSFHYSCLEKLKRTGTRRFTCPMRCRIATGENEVLIASNRPNDDDSISRRKVKGSYGTKVTKVVEDLLDVKDLGEKAVLFSQWEDMLDIVEDALKLNDIHATRCRSLRRIGKALHEFRSIDCTVLMLNVKNGAEGLTITEARHVFMLEPLLNNALDAQAINRVCRIGQKFQTTVHRYIVEETVESKIDALRLEHVEEVLEDTKSAKHTVRAGGVDGGFSSENELLDLLS